MDRPLWTMDHIVHEKLRFEDQVVPFSGHVYLDCVFIRCTLLVTSTMVPQNSNCRYVDCAWQLQLTVVDRQHWAEFVTKVMPLVEGSLVKVLGRDVTNRRGPSPLE